jgi:hypothetical protein
MQTRSKKSLWLLLVMVAALAAAFVITTGCTVGVRSGDAEFEVNGPPPEAFEADVVVGQPGADYVWVPGRYDWHGSRYEWVKGNWSRPPHAHAVWEAPRYEKRGEKHIYHPGRWRDQ